MPDDCRRKYRLIRHAAIFEARRPLSERPYRVSSRPLPHRAVFRPRRRQQGRQSAVRHCALFGRPRELLMGSPLVANTTGVIT